MFWPRVYDDVQDKLCRIIGDKYTPETTWNIFRTNRENPGNIQQLNVINIEEYQYVIPRFGCTCYQPF